MVVAKRFVLAAFLFTTFILHGSLLRFFINEPQARRRAALALLRKYCGLGTKIFGLQISVTNPQYLRPGQNYLIVGNHVSYLDALIVSYLAPVCFVTSVEMRHTFFLGLLTELAGCLYVERRSKDKIGDEILEIKEALEHGFHVVIFPEATSTNGSCLRPFKRPLFQAAVAAKCPLLCITVNYRYADGQALSAKNRDSLFWYGDMGFADHFLKFLAVQKTEIEITLHPEVAIGSEDNRDTLVEKAFAVVNSSYRPVL